MNRTSRGIGKIVIALTLVALLAVAAIYVLYSGGKGLGGTGNGQGHVVVTRINQFLTRSVNGSVQGDGIYWIEGFPGDGLSLPLGEAFNCTMVLDVTPSEPSYKVDSLSTDDGFVVESASATFPQIVSPDKGPLNLMVTLKAPSQPYQGMLDLSALTEPLDLGTGNESVLQLTAHVSPDSASPGQSISVEADIHNVLTRELTLYHFSMANPAYGPCEQSFLTRVEVFAGYYTIDNQSQGSQLLLYDPFRPRSCPPVGDLASTFQPQGSVNETSPLQGYWTTDGQNATFHNFSLGIYTVAVYDYWGQETILYFVVQGMGVSTPVPQTYFGYDGYKGYALSLLDSTDVSWYQDATVERTVAGVGVGVGIYINETDVNSNVTVSFYVSGSLVSTEDFSLSEIAGGAHPPTQLKIYGSLGFFVGTELPEGTNVTFGIHVDGPVYVTTYSSAQALDGFVSSGTLGTTVPAPLASLGFGLVAWGER